MDVESLRHVLREVEHAPDAMKRRAVHLIRTMIAFERSGPIDSLEIDAYRVPEEVYHVLYYMLKATTIPVSHGSLEKRSRERRASERASVRHDPASFSSLHWFAHVQQASGRAHLRARGITPSAVTRRLLHECKQSGYTFLSNPPTFVRPSQHFGRPVGEGLFALAPFARGQMIMQFTGAIHRRSTGKAFMKGKRRDYVIEMRYMGREFTIDPLDAATHQRVEPPNYAAYINEPSPPPFARMTNARHEPMRRNVLVHRYDHKRGVVRVEFADGRREDVSPEDLSTDATRATTAPLPYRANCSWFDFPVPLQDLYHKTRVKDNGICVYTRTSLHACTVTFRGADEIISTFEAHTNQAYSFEMRRDRVGKIATGDVLTLRDEQMEGLRRHGVVVRVRENEWDIHLRLKPDAAYKLPRIVYAGSLGEMDVPFPCIYACSDIRPGEELLCLYSNPLSTRGTGCRRLLDDADLRLPWNEYVT